MQVLEYVNECTMKIDKHRAKFRRVPTFIEIIFYIVSFPLTIFFAITSQLTLQKIVVVFTSLFIHFFSVHIAVFWLYSLGSLNKYYCFLKKSAGVLRRHANTVGYTNGQWKEIFPVLKYRACILDFCYVAMHFLFYVGFTITFIFIKHRIEPPLPYSFLIHILYSSVCILYCFIALFICANNLHQLRKANQTLYKCVSPC
uniref:Serpentine receptor class gamma n=1 Tax=Caenorhabditis tropicalis TaxID=1561998 RepID=A0A1I7TWU2_9PELO